MSQKAFRGWVMVVRERKHPAVGQPDGYPAGTRIRDELLQREPEFFRRVLTVYGDFDVVVQIEHDTLDGLYDLATRLGRLDAVSDTSTYVAAVKGGPVKDSRHQSVVRIRTIPGQEAAVLQKLIGLRGVDGADIVFGDYDILAVVNNDSGLAFSQVIRNIVAECPYITRTATLRYYPPEEPAAPPPPNGGLEAEVRRLRAENEQLRRGRSQETGGSPPEMGGEGYW